VAYRSGEVRHAGRAALDGRVARGSLAEFSASVRRSRPHATHYAEKVPFWLAAIAREVTPCRMIHLVRDPRDVFLSARAFPRVRPAAGFGMEAGAFGDAPGASHGARAPDGRRGCSAPAHEDDVSLGVSYRGPVGNAVDGARAAAVDRDGVRSSLGCHQ